MYVDTGLYKCDRRNSKEKGDEQVVSFSVMLAESGFFSLVIIKEHLIKVEVCQTFLRI